MSDEIGSDLIWGAPGLAEELHIPKNKAEYLIRTRQVRAKKIGGLWVISRKQLRAQFFGEEPLK